MTKRPRFSKLLLTCGFLLSALPFLQAEQVLTGEIEGAKFELTLPENPSGKLLLLAHGYRPEGLPLAASVGESHDLYSNLVDDGWAVASTSYRRNGWILEDAALDLINLHDHIRENVAYEPTLVILMGNSMGGGVVTWLSEHEPQRFDGALAMGAYLFEPIGDSETPSTTLAPYYSGKPQFPILFLTNTSELEGPAAYVSMAAEAAIAPVLWTIDREGHVNQNEAEQGAALAALVNWVESGEIEPDADGTIHAATASTAVFEGDTAKGRAITLVPVYGNIITSFVREDFQRLGLELGDSFSLSAQGQTVSVKLGKTYTDVPVGDWVGFWDADGYLLICRNYKNAVATLGLPEDAPIEIQKQDP
ncbi:SAM hydroxide adenosyltransferase [Pelagicoccus albus]|uniref:S-adenosyl-l-methionine hydroxide adenosyltransferase C-terminal domain-containing protein n=1 Tax=Pelagicoccus albus TaxID=415222 RepID=A0A7X1E961_9BACT|nr:SAM hydroxide adenosyltransferase [Pelagicoccus albus]MBC2607490.1 hypothetical protein [Pelagicoccus albus]